MKKIIFLFSLIVLINKVQAQTEKYVGTGFHFAAGISVGLPTGDFNITHSVGIGIEAQPEYNLSKMVSLYGSAGYTNFFGKKIDESFKVDNVGLIPVLVGAKVYVVPQFFVGTKLGLGILTGSGDSESAFDYQPQVGYNADKFQVNLGFNAFTKDGETLSNLSIGFVYKLK
jgi:hypothetical protein